MLIGKILCSEQVVQGIQFIFCICFLYQTINPLQIKLFQLIFHWIKCCFFFNQIGIVCVQNKSTLKNIEMESHVSFYNLNDGYNYAHWVFRTLSNLAYGLLFHAKIHPTGMVCYQFFGILVSLKSLHTFKENHLF